LSSKQIIGLTNNLAAEAKAMYINTVIFTSRLAMSDNSFATPPSPDSPKLLDRVRAKLRVKHYSIRAGIIGDGPLFLVSKPKKRKTVVYPHFRPISAISAGVGTKKPLRVSFRL